MQRVKGSWQDAAQKIVDGTKDLQQLDDYQLRKESLAVRYTVLSGQSVDEVLVRGFALVREAARRCLGMQHYPVQIIGGIAMHHGAIAVMQTGEGKTLAATLPLYLAALAGQGAHLATANDYLASRDAAQMKPVFEALGLTVGCVEQASEPRQRRKAYAADITYSTGKEIGFDFLRDRLQRRLDAEQVFTGRLSDSDMTAAENGLVQRDLHFMLVDEADSILIDEARTPLVISSLPDDVAERRALYQWSAHHVGYFEEPQHYLYNEARRCCELNAAGRTLTRKLPKPESLSRIAIIDVYDQIELALLVNRKFIRERHYVVRDGAVVIVDEFTGRMAEGRKWRAGLHQAIEAREGLEVTDDTSEAARITVQDLFGRYRTLCGMTGTVAGSARELYGIYETPVVHIPTNRPPCRRQLDDRVFGTAADKWAAIAAEAIEASRNGRPVLIGTRSIDKSEQLSRLLEAQNCPHQVLNARQLEHEATIVAAAGEAGRITVATNMAGRGTDIRLSPEALAAGGLHVIISEIHESERIDRQLIGRCGRQGDPGSYRFYMALDDEIILTGLGPKVAERWMRIGRKNRQLSASLARLFRRAQRRVEANHYRGRKVLLYQETVRQSSQRQLGQDPYVDTIS
jgi:preprotein translocase subunit SecA